jgi:hypothetical protein
VDKVTVAIVGDDEILIEEGNAVDGSDGMSWTYTNMQSNGVLHGTKIIAKAIDLAGNMHSMTVTLS